MRDQTPTPLRPMSECRPEKGDTELLFMRGYGFGIGTFCPAYQFTRHDGVVVDVAACWIIDCRQGGDFWPHADPDLVGFLPLNPPAE